jgi:hypothetical protein
MLDWLDPDYITKAELFLRGYDVPCYHKNSYLFCCNGFLLTEGVIYL